MVQFADESTLRLVEDPNSGDDRLLVRFHMVPRPDPIETEKQGRPIYVDQEYIEIVVPGDKDNTINRPISDEDKLRFRRAYRHWKETGETAKTGMPLSMAPFLTAAQVEELRFFNVTTVEALATLADSHTDKFMGLQGLKQKAIQFMDAAKGAAPMNKVNADLEKLRDENAALKNMLKEQGDKIDQLTKQRR